MELTSRSEVEQTRQTTIDDVVRRLSKAVNYSAILDSIMGKSLDPENQLQSYQTDAVKRFCQVLSNTPVEHINANQNGEPASFSDFMHRFFFGSDYRNHDERLTILQYLISVQPGSIRGQEALKKDVIKTLQSIIDNEHVEDSKLDEAIEFVSGLANALGR